MSFQDNPHFAYVLTSTILWMVPGLFILGTDFELFRGIFIALLGGFCGACGGWAIGVLKYDVMLSNMSLVQE